MKKVVTSLSLLSMLVFSGCSTDTTNDNLGVLDEDKPRITLYGEKDIYINLGTMVVLENDNFIAEDTVDGDLTDYVERTHNIDFTRAGEYQVTYFVEDSDGFSDTQTRSVTIVDPDYDSSTDNQNSSGNVDLGTQVGNENDSGNVDLGTPIGGSTYSDIESFKVWYYNTCGETFNESLYNATTSSYSGKIDCSNKGLDYIDLSQLSIFNSIDSIDLGYNNLTDIDFSPIQDIQGLNYLYINNNTATLKSQYDTVSERNALFNFFTNLHGGDGKTGLFIGFKPHQQDSDEETLRISF
ncbi:MAG: DUF5011 domain-containing protein [Epsilonproteobacteria bacterium]|nr:DUF5011 domain-containing protein [Campylobacterota bacterium]